MEKGKDKGRLRGLESLKKSSISRADMGKKGVGCMEGRRGDRKH